ncbi:MAG: response regulator [Chloroflexi bacterium]|nr:response regulator [Chloroflexota bacterium]
MSEPLILVSDDNLEIREFLEEVLDTLGHYRVHSVGDGMSALSLVKDLRPDLVITDQQMPNLTGTELIHRLKMEFPLLPVILMTGESTEALAVEALRQGAVDYLVKPFDPDTLMESIRRALGAARRWQELAGTPIERTKRQKDLSKPEANVDKAVTTLGELDQVLNAAVNTAVQLTGAEEGSLLLLDEASGELYMRASKNFNDEFASSFRVFVQDSLAGQVIESGAPVMLDESTPQKIKTSYLVHSLLYVPLRIRDRIIGVLGVDNQTPGKKLSDKDRAILITLADYSALAIDNAQLFLRSETERLQLETILDQIENGVIVIDSENRLMILNHTAQQALEIEGEFIGEDVNTLLFDPKLRALIASQEENVQREEIELSDGRVFSAQKTLIEGVGQAIVMQDVTYLKELDRIKSEFVTTVSHDLRSPLTAILGYIELIERTGEINEQQEEFIRRIQNSVEQISLMITDLLDLGRIEAGLDTTKEPTNIRKLALEVVDNLESAARTADVKFNIDLEEEIGVVFGDPIRLRQMVTNLLDNAIKYTRAGGEVSFGMRAENRQVILNISDNGSGIPQNELPLLFDRFFRGSNVADDIPGTGLGLAIVKSILDNHNGRIWVDSSLGSGASFTVVLPLVADESQPEG